MDDDCLLGLTEPTSVIRASLETVSCGPPSHSIHLPIMLSMTANLRGPQRWVRIVEMMFLRYRYKTDISHDNTHKSIRFLSISFL